ncbi:MAG: phasin family protein [Rhodospirillales bacterium]
MSNAKKTTAETVTETAEAAMAAGQETVEAAVKAGTDAAAKGYEKAVAMSKEHVEAAVKAGTEAFKNGEDLTAYNKDNLDAAMASGAVFAKGVQDMNKAFFALAQASMEDSAAATRRIMACKSLNDVFAVQSDLARTGYEKAVAESRRFSDMGVKLAEEAAAPVTQRVAVTVEKFAKPLAA